MAIEETILVDFEVDQKGALRDLQDVTRELENNKKARTALTAEIRKSKTVTVEQAKQLTLLNQKIKQNQADQKSFAKTIDTTSGSLNAMRRQLEQNKIILGDMPQRTDKQRKAFKSLQIETDKLNKKITEQEKGYGVATREVGKYENAQGALATVSPRLAGGLSQATNAVKLFTASLLTNPIFAIIAAIAALGYALSQFFTRSQRGIEKWTIISGQFDQVLNDLLDSFADLGEVIYDFGELIATDPVEAFKKLGNAIIENIVNRFKGGVEFFQSGGVLLTNTILLLANKAKIALSDVPLIGKKIDVAAAKKNIEELSSVIENELLNFGDAFLQIQTGVDGILTGASNAISTDKLKLRKYLDEQKIALEKAQVQFIILEQRRNKKVSELRLKAEQKEKFSIQQRVKFLEEALSLEQANLNDKIALQEKTIAYDLINGQNIKTEAEAINRINQLRLYGTDIQIDEIGLNKSSLKDQEELYKSVKALDELRESSFNTLKRLETRLNALRAEEGKGTVVKSTLDTDIKEAEKRNQERVKQEKAEQDSIIRLSLFRLEQKVKEAQGLEDQKQAELDLLTANYNAQKLLTEQTDADKILAHEKFLSAKNDLDQKYTDKQLELDRLLIEQKLATTSNALSAISSLFDQNTVQYKTIASAKATIDTYAGATQAFNDPTVPSATLRTINAAAIVLSGLANVAKINNVKFEKGGVIQGASHDQGGVPFTVQGRAGFEAEGGEFIVNKEATKQNLGLLTAINGGNKGGTFLANGGQISTVKGLSRNIDQQAFNNNAIIRTIKALPPPVVGVNEIINGINTVRVKENTGL